jgi:glyoxalase family protein
MENRILGLHHITAIAGNAQRNYEFYTKVLGLRLVKKTVNFDDPVRITFISVMKPAHQALSLHSFPGKEWEKVTPAVAWRQTSAIRYQRTALPFGKIVSNNLV